MQNKFKIISYIKYLNGIFNDSGYFTLNKYLDMDKAI